MDRHATKTTGRPVLLTTNKPLAALGHVLHDGNLAGAILDEQEDSPA